MKIHWITNCHDFKDGDKTASFKSQITCVNCLSKLYYQEEQGFVENHIVAEYTTAPTNKFTNNLAEIVAQLASCGYECEAGPLEKNVAFIELQRMAAQHTRGNGI